MAYQLLLLYSSLPCAFSSVPHWWPPQRSFSSLSIAEYWFSLFAESETDSCFPYPFIVLNNAKHCRNKLWLRWHSTLSDTNRGDCEVILESHERFKILAMKFHKMNTFIAEMLYDRANKVDNFFRNQKFLYA